MAAASPSSFFLFLLSLLSNSNPSSTKFHFLKPQSHSRLRVSTTIHSELTTLPVLSFEGNQVGSASLNLKSAPPDTARAVVHRGEEARFSTALASAFECTVVVEDFGDKFEKPKTKEFIAMMNRLGLDPKKKSMFLMTEVSDNVRLSSRNIGTLKLLTPRTLNLFDILDSEKLILTKGAVEFLNERYGLDSEEDKEEDEFEEVEYADEG
ncbi:UNVERIFIED_CONTAM: 50S ribosomal protein L4, chloroplastic [Sesamum calycinum]|uniref:Large ribosomal subunit protein uL4c n=1 Tax=Sesamum calycinum TaxID=2727403 RepID=A0AAW2KTW9_9LAMI